MPPRIAITCWRRPLPTFLDPQTDLYTLGAEYVEANRAAGSVPLLLAHPDEHEVTGVLGVVDGLVLSGGGDVEPRHAGWDVLGVQWHPEKTVIGDDTPLYTAFVDVVRT